MRYSKEIVEKLKNLYNDDFTKSTEHYRVIKSIDELKEGAFVFFPFRPLFGVTEVIVRRNGSKALYANSTSSPIQEEYIHLPLIELINFSKEDFQKTFEDHEMSSIDEFYINDVYSWYYSIENESDLSQYNLKGFPSMNEIISVIRKEKQEEINLINLLSKKIELSEKLNNKSIIKEIVLEKDKFPNLEIIVKDYPSISILNKDLSLYWTISITT